jgi:tripartite-type tricarboxylate transporter receptor subunit TctC
LSHVQKFKRVKGEKKMKKKVCMLMSSLLVMAIAIGGCGTSKNEVVEVSQVESEVGQVDDDGAVKQPEGFPSTNIQFLLPIPAGGMVDVAMRALADVVDFGEPVVVTNRPGADQTIGLTEVNLKKDSHIVTAAGLAGFIIQPNLIDLTYSVDDFRYIGLTQPPEAQVIVSSADSKYQTWEDIVGALNAGEEVTYSAANTNGLGRIALMEVMSQENISAKYVPFTGSSEGFAALLGGHIDFYIMDASVVAPRILDKQFTGLMVVGKDRISNLPEVPSAEELGLEDMEKLVGFVSIAVSKDTPDEIVDWIKFKIDEAQQSDAYKEYLNNVVGTEEELKVYTEEEITEMMHSTNDAITEIMKKNNMITN